MELMSEEDRNALVRLQAQVEGWMQTTTEYRIALCSKIEKIMLRLENLPCRERAEMYKGISATSKLMWAAIGCLATLLFIHLGWK